MGEPKLMRFAQIRPLGSVLGTSFRSPPSQSSENFRGHEKAGEDRGDNWYLSRLEFFHNTFLPIYLLRTVQQLDDGPLGGRSNKVRNLAHCRH